MVDEVPFQFDVFLSHNSSDKVIVRELKHRLSIRELKVWLDEDELRPGMRWQEHLELGIRASKSVVVVVGKNGLGPWEIQEMHSALILAVSNNRPVIPVLLPDAPLEPKFPMFLEIRTYVRLDAKWTEEAIGRIVWGITGNKPAPAERPAPLADLQPGPGVRVRCQLRCRDSRREVIHTSSMGLIVGLCLKFPKTEFRLSRENSSEEPSNLKVPMDVMMAQFGHGEILILEVVGEFEMMAARFLKTALENMEGYVDDPAKVKRRIEKLAEAANQGKYDAHLQEIENNIIRAAKEALLTPEEEHRNIAVINDRLHDTSLVMLPLLARHFDCDLEIGFELPQKGVFSFRINKANEFALERRILSLDIPVGTGTTVVMLGKKSKEAGLAVKQFLENLWQCDQWIRRKGREIKTSDGVSQLVEFAREMALAPTSAYHHVQNPFISNLVSVKNVFVNGPDTSFGKAEVLRQLAAPHHEQHDLELEEILRGVEATEAKLCFVLRPGFALSHTALPQGPRISVSFGVYPNGVRWTSGDDPVQLVVMVICAQDAYRTWLDYLKRFSTVFESVPNLQHQLVAARTGEEFMRLLRSAEISLINA
jgi:mannitol/fructose-specific phosphotransferase system IIA component (Ntr-type)/phosphotransferase system HPr-like phosphotransfer protein